MSMMMMIIIINAVHL